MSKDAFKALIKPIADCSRAHSLDADFAALLNRLFPGDGPVFQAIEAACQRAIEEGWMCANEHRGIRYGRAIEGPIPILPAARSTLCGWTISLARIIATPMAKST